MIIKLSIIIERSHVYMVNQVRRLAGMIPNGCFFASLSRHLSACMGMSIGHHRCFYGGSDELDILQENNSAPLPNSR